MGFFWPAGLCLNPGPTLDPIINVFIRYIWIFRICFRYYGYCFWFTIRVLISSKFFKLKKKLGIWIKFWVFFSSSCEILNKIFKFLGIKIFLVFVWSFKYFSCFGYFSDFSYILNFFMILNTRTDVDPLRPYRVQQPFDIDF